jgi:predicted transposase YdaD
VAKELAKISSEEERQNISGCTEILAGLRYDKDLIRQLFRGDIMQESVIYQDIIQTGRQQGEVALIKRQLSRRLGNIDSAILQRIEGLSIQQLESLAEALLDFTTVEDLLIWLNQSN